MDSKKQVKVLSAILDKNISVVESALFALVFEQFTIEELEQKLEAMDLPDRGKRGRQTKSTVSLVA